jgi:uncharacterized membrane protein
MKIQSYSITNKNIQTMKTENSVLMQKALESLKGKWGVAIGGVVIYYLIMAIAQIGPRYSHPYESVTISLAATAQLIITGPMVLGMAIFALNISRGKEARVEQLFDGFKRFGTALSTYLLMILFVILWMLLLIVPGIVAALSYSMTFYILADDKSIGAMEAIDKSKAMMDGYKWKYFFLNLRFVGWAILCIFTLGIGFLWLVPYMIVSSVKFYDDIKEAATETDMGFSTSS